MNLFWTSWKSFKKCPKIEREEQRRESSRQMTFEASWRLVVSCVKKIYIISRLEHPFLLPSHFSFFTFFAAKKPLFLQIWTTKTWFNNLNKSGRIVTSNRPATKNKIHQSLDKLCVFFILASSFKSERDRMKNDEQNSWFSIPSFTWLLIKSSNKKVDSTNWTNHEQLWKVRFDIHPNQWFWISSMSLL